MSTMTLQPPSKHDPFCFPVIHFNSCTEQSMLHAIEQIGISMARWDFRNHQVIWSKQLATLYGLETEPFCRSCQDYLKLIHPDDRADLKSILRQVEQTLENGEVEYRVSVDRQEKWFRSTFTPITEDGRLTDIIEFVTDISELKSAQAALVYSELRWRNVLGCISDVLIETTLSGEIISTTNSIISLWGYHPDELRGINLCSIIEFEDGFSFESSSSINSDFLPLTATANVLLKSHTYCTSECSVHVDAVRQTLLFIFKPGRQSWTQSNPAPSCRSVVPTLFHALENCWPLPTIYTMISEQLAGLLQADCIHIYQYHPEQTDWRAIFEYSHRSSFRCAAHHPFPVREALLPEMLDRLNGWQMDSLGRSSYACVSDFISQVVGGWMLLPILVNASLWGCILIMRLDQSNHWNTQELKQAALLGDYLNWAIAARKRE